MTHTQKLAYSTRITLTTCYGEFSVSTNRDDLDLADTFAKLIEPMLLAAGYSQESIDAYLDTGKPK